MRVPHQQRSLQLTPTRSADAAPSSSRPAALHIALPVALSAFAILVVLTFLVLCRRRWRRTTGSPYMHQPYAPAAYDDSFGTTTTSSFGSGRATGRGIPNPFADAESPRASMDANHALDAARASPISQPASPQAPFRDVDTWDDPFGDAAAALEAPHLAPPPRLSSTPRSEGPRFVWGADASASSLANHAGHSTPHLAFSGPEPVPEMAQFQGAQAFTLVMPARRLDRA